MKPMRAHRPSTLVVEILGPQQTWLRMERLWTITQADVESQRWLREGYRVRVRDDVHGTLLWDTGMVEEQVKQER